MAPNPDSDFSQKYSFLRRFFDRSFAKLRHTAKRPTVLSSYQRKLTISITFRKINFFTNFRIFCKGLLTFFWKKCQKLKISRFECQCVGIEITSLTRYGIPHSDLYFYYGSQKTEFLWQKIGLKFLWKMEIQIFVKNANFFFGFSIVV